MSALPPEANVRSVPILLQKSAIGAVWRAIDWF
jgi:hypothetical protein